MLAALNCLDSKVYTRDSLHLSFIKLIRSLQTGAIAIAVANPTDLVKVRLQAEGKLPSGVPKRYYGTMDAYYTIVKQVLFYHTVPLFFFPYTCNLNKDNTIIRKD